MSRRKVPVSEETPKQRATSVHLSPIAQDLIDRAIEEESQNPNRFNKPKANEMINKAICGWYAHLAPVDLPGQNGHPPRKRRPGDYKR